MLQFRAGMNRRQLLAFLNSKPIQFFQFNTKAVATLALQKQQTRQFWYTKIVRDSSGILSSMPTLDVQENAIENEEFSVKKEEEEGKTGVEQQQEKQVEEAENNSSAGKEPIGDQKMFGRKIYPGQSGQQQLHIQYKMGKSGQKYFEIYRGKGTTANKFANICVPEDVFEFVRAMDEVLNAVNAKKKSIIGASPNRQERLVLHVANAKGMFYDYRLELYMFNNAVFVQMDAVANESTGPGRKSRYMLLSLHQFHWLRNRIGELITDEQAVQQQLGKPPGYPAWLNRDGRPLNRQQQTQSFAAQPQSLPKMQSQQQQAILQQLLQLVLQQQQQLQQMQAANAVRNNSLGMGNAGFGGVVPQGPDQIILMSDLLAQQQQQQAFTPAAPTMYNNNQLDQTALVNLLAQFQQSLQSTAPTMNNNTQLMNLVNLLLQNNSGQQN